MTAPHLSTAPPSPDAPDEPGSPRGARAAARRRTPGRAADLATATAAALLFATAAAVGAAINGDNVLRLKFPPMHAYWEPHLGPGTPAALIVAGLVVLYGPAAARRLPWGWLPAVAAAGSLAWLWSLALVDGWEQGVTIRLNTKGEYLRAVDSVDGIGHFLSTFTEHILWGTEQEPWPAHVAGHPPGALLTFVGLDRIGLGGGAWAAAFVLAAAASAAAAVLLTVRALAGEDLARRAAPFLVLAPGAVWMGVSADGYFAAVAAWALALLALAATGAVRARRTAALGSGLLFGLLLYLSYGMVLMGIVGLAVLMAARAWRPLPWVLAGVAVWAAAFTVGGFWWFDGYFTLVERYYQGVAGVRPYSYYVWANVAVQVAAVGLAAVAGLRRGAAALPGAAREGVAELRGGRPLAGRTGLLVLLAGAVCAMLTADLSGMSKGETERIWLPFTLWLLPAAALLPRPHIRWWLLAQAAVALTINHLWLTRW